MVDLIFFLDARAALPYYPDSLHKYLDAQGLIRTGSNFLRVHNETKALTTVPKVPYSLRIIVYDLTGDRVSLGKVRVVSYTLDVFAVAVGSLFDLAYQQFDFLF